MLTVCSLIFLVLYTLRVQNFARRKVREFWSHSRKFIHAKKPWNLWFGKVDPRKKKLVSSIPESSSTRKFLLLFYQLYTFLLRLSSFISWKKCFQPIWRRTYLEELLYCSRQNIQYESFQTVKNIVFFIFEITSFEERNQQQFLRFDSCEDI